MRSQLISNLKAFLRALVLVLLLGTGLWLMDQIAQTSIAARTDGSNAGQVSNPASPAPLRQSTPPEGYTSLAQAPATTESDTTGKTPGAQTPGIPMQAASAEPPPQPATEPVKSPGDGKTPDSAKTSSQGTNEPQNGRPRFQRRANIQYIVTEPILFNTASSEIRRTSLEQLRMVATLLSERRDVKLLIVGFTDNLGMPENNQHVSAERAAAVKDFLVTQGIDVSRLESRGMGSQDPIASNDTQLGRQANRRIEFIVTSPK